MGDIESVLSLVSEHLRAARESTPGFVPSEEDTLRIISRQQALVDYMQDQSHKFNPTISPEFVLFTNNVPGGQKLTLTIHPAHIPPELDIDHVGLHLFTFENREPEFFPFAAPYAPGFLETSSPTVLTIGKHMDAATKNQTKRLVDDQQIIRSNLQTLYVIGQDNNPESRIGKISVFPRTVIDGRIEVSNREMPLKHIRSPLGQEDVTVINQALTILETSR